MNESEAREWIFARWGGAAIDRLSRFREMLEVENTRQNLVAASTLDVVWVRHLLDSAQLVPIVDGIAEGGEWVDIGSGAGLPGLVVACLQDRHVHLIEPRRRRTEFLTWVANELKINVSIVQREAASYRLPKRPAAIVSARAVASLEKIFSISSGFTTDTTIWVLPKGRSVQNELADVRSKWQGVFHVEQSLTSSDSAIVVAKGVRPL